MGYEIGFLKTVWLKYHHPEQRQGLYFPDCFFRILFLAKSKNQSTKVARFFSRWFRIDSYAHWLGDAAGMADRLMPTITCGLTFYGFLGSIIIGRTLSQICCFNYTITYQPLTGLQFKPFSVSTFENFNIFSSGSSKCLIFFKRKFTPNITNSSLQLYTLGPHRIGPCTGPIEIMFSIIFKSI